jgi:hypothetical protein
LAEPRFRHRAQVDERGQELGVVGGHHQVGVQQHGGAHAHGVALDADHQRLFEAAHGADKGRRAAFGAFTGGQEVGQVVAGAEGFAGPQDQHRAHVIAVAGEGQQVDQVAVHGAGQGVEFVRAVQGQGEHRAVFGRQHLTALQRG